MTILEVYCSHPRTHDPKNIVGWNIECLVCGEGWDTETDEPPKRIIGYIEAHK